MLKTEVIERTICTDCEGIKNITIDRVKIPPHDWHKRGFQANALCCVCDDNPLDDQRLQDIAEKYAEKASLKSSLLSAIRLVYVVILPIYKEFVNRVDGGAFMDKETAVNEYLDKILEALSYGPKSDKEGGSNNFVRNCHRGPLEEAFDAVIANPEK